MSNSKKANNANNENNANNAKTLNECKTHYCDKIHPKYIKKMVDSIKQSFTKKMSPEAKKKFIANMDKSMKKNSNKKKDKESCIKIYCNKGCKGTILEDGKDFPKSVELQFAKNKIFKDKKLAKTMLTFAKNNRKDLFKNGKTTVLKDNFYEKTKRTRVSQLKKDKAISGCAIMML